MTRQGGENLATAAPSIGQAIAGASANSELITDVSGQLAQNTLGLLRYQCLGKLSSANMNIATDQAIAIGASSYAIKEIIVCNASTNLTTAVGGVYTAASKGGSAVVANTQVYTALTGATKYVGLTLAALVGTDLRTDATLYLSLTLAQGGAATADVYVFGLRLS